MDASARHYRNCLFDCFKYSYSYEALAPFFALLPGTNVPRTVTFIVVVECEDGSLFTAFVQVTLNPGYHQQIIKCDDLRPSSREELIEQLQTLNVD